MIRWAKKYAKTCWKNSLNRTKCKALKHTKRWIDDAKQVYTRARINSIYVVIYLVNEFISEVTLKTEKKPETIYTSTLAQ